MNQVYFIFQKLKGEICLVQISLKKNLIELLEKIYCVLLHNIFFPIIQFNFFSVYETLLTIWEMFNISTCYNRIKHSIERKIIGQNIYIPHIPKILIKSVQ